MKTLRTMALVALAAIVAGAGAVVASAAQAVEGPVLRVGGARLLEKGSEPIESKGGTYILTAGTIKITCTSQVVEKGELIGSTGANAGTSKEKMKFSGCTVAGNGANSPETAGECKVAPTGTIATEPVKNTLDFANEKSVKGETVLTLFQPAVGTVLGNVGFEGSCKLTLMAVEGSVAAEAFEGKEKAVKVEEEAAEAEKGFVNFPAFEIKVDWVESGGVRTKVSVGLTVFGKAFTFTGKSEIKLTSKKVWGVFTK